MKIVMYGAPLGAGGAMTELPFLLDGRIERIYKDAVDLKSLEADIAIANFTRDPLNSGNETGWNYVRLPKVKVQLAIQAEHFSEYIPEWSDGITHNFDGSICFDFNKPFFEFDDSIHPCFARSYWDEHGFTVKPRFYFDPLVKWNGFYPGPVKDFSDYGYCIGSVTTHRQRVCTNNNRVKMILGDVRNQTMIQEFRKSGIGINVHKFQLRGLCPETDKTEVKNVEKTEAIRLSFFYNCGLAVVSEKLDHMFPERLKNCIKIIDDMETFIPDIQELSEQVQNTKKVFNEYHDLNTELDNLIQNIVKEYNL